MPVTARSEDRTTLHGTSIERECNASPGRESGRGDQRKRGGQFRGVTGVQRANEDPRLCEAPVSTRKGSNWSIETTERRQILSLSLARKKRQR